MPGIVIQYSYILFDRLLEKNVQEQTITVDRPRFGPWYDSTDITSDFSGDRGGWVNLFCLKKHVLSKPYNKHVAYNQYNRTLWFKDLS